MHRPLNTASCSGGRRGEHLDKAALPSTQGAVFGATEARLAPGRRAHAASRPTRRHVSSRELMAQYEPRCGTRRRRRRCSGEARGGHLSWEEGGDGGEDERVVGVVVDAADVDHIRHPHVHLPVHPMYNCRPAVPPSRTASLLQHAKCTMCSVCAMHKQHVYCTM